MAKPGGPRGVKGSELLARLLTLKRKHESEEQFCERVGLSHSLISKWRHDQQGVSLQSLLSIRAKTGKGLDWLVFGPGAVSQDTAAEAVSWIVREINQVLVEAAEAYLPAEDMSAALDPVPPTDQHEHENNRRRA